MIVSQDLHITDQTVIERLRLLTEPGLHLPCQLADGLDAVDPGPEEAAVLIQINVAHPRLVENLLGDLGIDALVDHVNGHLSIRLIPGILGMMNWNIIQIIFALLFCHILLL